MPVDAIENLLPERHRPFPLADLLTCTWVMVSAFDPDLVALTSCVEVTVVHRVA